MSPKVGGKEGQGIWSEFFAREPTVEHVGTSEGKMRSRLPTPRRVRETGAEGHQAGRESEIQVPATAELTPDPH